VFFRQLIKPIFSLGTIPLSKMVYSAMTICC